MRVLNSFFLFVYFFIFASSLFAEKDSLDSTRTNKSESYSISAFKDAIDNFLSSVKFAKTKNGINVASIKYQNQKIISAHIHFNNGGWSYDVYDGKNLHGIGHLIASILSLGPSTMTETEYREFLLKNGITIDFECIANSFTISIDSVVDCLDIAIDMVYKTISSPRIDQNSLKRVIEIGKKRITYLPEISGNSGFATRELVRLLFPNNDFISVPLGTIDSISSITIHDVNKYILSVFNKENMHVYFAGGLDREDIEYIVDSAFANLAVKSKINQKVKINPEIPMFFAGTHKIKSSSAKLATGDLCFAQSNVSMHDDRLVDSTFLRMLLLGDLAKSKNKISSLRDIRERYNLSYYFFLKNAKMNGEIYENFMYGCVNSSESNVVRTSELIKNEFKIAKSMDQMSEAVLDEIKFLFFKNQSIYISLSTMSSVADFLLLATLINRSDDFSKGPEYLQRMYNRAFSLKMEDLKSIANELIDPNKLSFVFSV